MAHGVLMLSVGGSAIDEIVGPLERREMTVTIAQDLDTAMHRLAEHQLIILDAADESALALLCRRINDAAGANHPPILAVAHSREVEERVKLLESGADDVLARPVDERELEAIVEALLLRGGPVRTEPEPAVAAAPSPPTGPGRVIAFAAAKGGSGTTTLAVNTAVVLAEMAPGNVAIVDLDMLHGQVATHLDIYGRISTAELAREEFSGLGPEMIRESGRRHSSGLIVFGGPYRPDEALEVTGSQLAALVQAVRDVYATVVVDVGSSFDLRALPVFEHADRVVLVLTPDIPSLRLLHGALQVLSETGSAADRATYVVNDIHPRPMIGPEQIEEHLGLKVSLKVPYDGESFVKAVNEGQPFIVQARRSPPAVAIRRLAETLAGDAAADDGSEPQRRGRLRGLLGRTQ